jgi:choline kinase/phosphatidylglycerophosphate synthase
MALDQSLRPAEPEPVLTVAVRPAVGVILAAGRSERLAGLTGGSSKALLQLGGMALLERQLLSLLRAGIQRLVVVVGHDWERVAGMASVAAPGRVEVVKADCWEAGNGTSLAAAEAAVRGEALFLVITADHLFGAGAVEELLGVGEPAALIDTQAAPEVIAEGTRVTIADGLALAFGKELDGPYVDCGAFLVQPRIFECQRQAAAEGDHSLAGALTRLAQQQPLRAVSLPSGSWWVDVDTADDHRRALRSLRRSLAKPSDGLVARLLNRPLSTRLSMALAPLRVGPDLVTVIVFFLGLLGALALGTAHGLVGGLLVQLSSVVDGVDGELGRLRMQGSSRGAILDSVLDRVADAAILVALGVWTLNGPLPPAAVLLLTGAALSGAFLSMALKDRAAALRLPGFPERRLGLLLAGRDGRLFLVAVFAVLGQPLPALIAVVATSALAAAVRLYIVWRRQSPTG